MVTSHSTHLWKKHSARIKMIKKTRRSKLGLRKWKQGYSRDKGEAPGHITDVWVSFPHSTRSESTELEETPGWLQRCPPLGEQASRFTRLYIRRTCSWCWLRNEFSKCTHPLRPLLLVLLVLRKWEDSSVLMSLQPRTYKTTTTPRRYPFIAFRNIHLLVSPASSLV